MRVPIASGCEGRVLAVLDLLAQILRYIYCAYVFVMNTSHFLIDKLGDPAF
jgi:hypothetical protein